MYQLTSSPFGKFKRYTLRHSQHGHAIRFIPERGGCLLSLMYNDQEYIDGYQTLVTSAAAMLAGLVWGGMAAP